MEFGNTFGLSLSGEVISPARTRRTGGGLQDNALAFSNEFLNRFVSTDEKTAEYSLTDFRNSYSNSYHNSFSNSLSESGFSYHNDFTDGIHVSRRDGFEPLTLVVRRKGLSNTTQLCDPLNGEAIYTVNEHYPGFMSQKPNLEVFRAVSGDALVGTVRYRGFSAQINSAATGETHGDIDTFKSFTLREQNPDSKLSWEITQCKTRPKSQLREDGSAVIKVTEPLVKLEMGDSSHPSDQPLCVASLYTVRPVGLIKVYARSACINHEGGDWAALDELVLSAYANMERARRRVMRGGQADMSGPAAYLVAALVEISPLVLSLVLFVVLFYFQWVYHSPLPTSTGF